MIIRIIKDFFFPFRSGKRGTRHGISGYSSNQRKEISISLLSALEIKKKSKTDNSCENEHTHKSKKYMHQYIPGPQKPLSVTLKIYFIQCCHWTRRYKLYPGEEKRDDLWPPHSIETRCSEG